MLNTKKPIVIKKNLYEEPHWFQKQIHQGSYQKKRELLIENIYFLRLVGWYFNWQPALQWLQTLQRYVSFCTHLKQVSNKSSPKTKSKTHLRSSLIPWTTSNYILICDKLDYCQLLPFSPLYHPSNRLNGVYIFYIDTLLSQIYLLLWSF